MAFPRSDDAGRATGCTAVYTHRYTDRVLNLISRAVGLFRGQPETCGAAPPPRRELRETLESGVRSVKSTRCSSGVRLCVVLCVCVKAPRSCSWELQLAGPVYGDPGRVSVTHWVGELC